MPIESLRRQYPIDGAVRPLVVTETTRMSGTTMCVAAIDLHDLRMVRPLGPTGANWTKSDTPDPFAPGTIVATSYIRSSGAQPHANEDARCPARPAKIGVCTPVEFYEINAAAAATSVSRAFGSAPRSNKYVVEGTECPSLAGLVVAAKTVNLRESFDKQRATFKDAANSLFDFPITALAAAGDRIDGLRAQLARANTAGKKLVLRLGLGRPWPGKPPGSYDPKRCYLQVNGFVFPPDV